MQREKKAKGVDIVSTMKPIQATPELHGKDAIRLLNQVNATPTEKAMKKIQCYVVSLTIYVNNELFERQGYYSN